MVSKSRNLCRILPARGSRALKTAYGAHNLELLCFVSVCCDDGTKRFVKCLTLQLQTKTITFDILSLWNLFCFHRGVETIKVVMVRGALNK